MAIFVVRGNTLSLPPAHATSSVTGSISIQVQASGGFTWNQSAFQAKIDPSITTGPLVGIPIFDIPEGQAGFEVDIGALVSGNPAKVVMVHDPSNEYQLAGVTWDATTKKFKYNGAAGLGAVSVFRAWATAGETFVPETDPVPYVTLRPISTTRIGPMWFTAVIGKDGNNTNGLQYLWRERSAMHPTSFANFENIGGDWWGLGEVPQGSTPYDSFAVTGGGPTGQVIVRDVTNIWKKFENGSLPNWGFWFWGLAPALVNFYGKADTGGRGPLLTITWSDDTQTTLQAACSNHIQAAQPGKNTSDQFQCSASPSRGLVYFDPTGLSQSKRVKTVTLGLTVAYVYTAGQIVMNLVRWQGQDDVTADPYTGGISDDYDADVGLENHPSVLSVARWPSSVRIDGNNFLSNYLLTEQSLRGWRGLTTEASTDPLTCQHMLVLGQSDSDPAMSGFVPLKPGINAYRRFLRAGVSGGGYSIAYEPYARCGWNTAGQRQSLDAPADAVNFGADAQELWTRCYVRWARSPGGGHHGPGMMGRYEGKLLGNDTRTGRPWDSPVRLNITDPNPVRWYWQLEPLGVQAGDIVDSEFNWTGNPPTTYTVDDPVLKPLRYRPLGSYDYFCAQTGQTTREDQCLFHFHRKLRGMIIENRWYCVEHHCRVNTFTGSTPNDDASAEIYINGRFVTSRESYGAFHIAPVPGIGITEAFLESFSPAWPPASQGVGPTPYDCMTYHSQMVVATQRIGIGKF